MSVAAYNNQQQRKKLRSGNLWFASQTYHKLPPLRFSAVLGVKRKEAIMDLREYEYITKRPDTFPRSTLREIREFMCKAGSTNVYLLDKVLSEGYITPPREYAWHGCYKIILSDEEKASVLKDLSLVEANGKNRSTFSDEEKGSLEQYIRYWKRCLDEIPISYDEYKGTQKYYDLRNISEDEFSDFLFNHTTATQKNKSDPWYWDSNIWLEYNVHHLARLYEKIFKSAGKLSGIYSATELEQGFWAILGDNLECSVYNLIWNSALEIEIKENLILSIYDLYKNLYDFDPLDTSCDMWWDSLAYSYYDGGPRNPEQNESDKKIQDVMFFTLKRILELKSESCQMAALHGLGHLRHPDTRTVIEAYMNEHSNLTDDQVSYAKACIEGDIM